MFAFRLTLLLLVILSAPRGFANDILPGRASDRSILLHSGTIHPISSQAIENGKLLIKAGLIAAVGAADDVFLEESDAIRVDCAGKHLYPGLISANGTLGLVEISAVRATRDTSEPGMLNPSVRAEIAINPDSELIPVTRSNGVLVSLSVPQTSGGLVSGKSALIAHDGWTWEQMTVKAPVGMHLFWPSMRGSSSGSDKALKAQADQRKKSLDQLKALINDARNYQKSKAVNDRSFRSDVRLEAMLPVLDKSLPVFLHASSIAQIQSALQFVAKEDLKAVLVSGHDIVRVIPLLKQRKIPVILTNVQSLPLRRWEPYDHPMTVPSQLHQAGVPFCIANGSGQPGSSSARNLPYLAAAAVPFGLPADEAIRAITLSPAQILGVADRLGSLEKGKHATLFVSTGNPLEITSNVTRAYIQGREIDLSNRQVQLYRKYQEKYRRARSE